MTLLTLPRTLLLSLGASLAVVLAFIANDSAAMGEPTITSTQIEILNAQPLTLTLDSQNKAATTLFIRNIAAAPAVLSFEAVVKSLKDNTFAETTVKAKSARSNTDSNTIDVPPYQVGQPSELVSLEIASKASPPAEGYLVVALPASTDNKKVLANIQLKLRLPITSWLVNLLVFGALASASFIAFYSGRQLTKQKQDLCAEMGMPLWSFAGSWASNLTVASGVLNTTLAVTVLSEQTYYLNRSTYTVLNMLFVGISGLAPIVYNFTRKTVENATAVDGVEYRGRIAWFLIASAITLWAVLGQLGMQTLTLLELHAARQLPTSVFVTLLIALAVLTILLVIYAIYTICKTATMQTIKKIETSREAIRVEAEKAGRAIGGPIWSQPRWALL